MRKLACSLIVLGSTHLAFAQGGVYQSGTDYAQGQAVHSYTNAGAAQFRRSVVKSEGVIRCSTPKASELGLSATAPAPKAFSYDESNYRGGRRLVTAYTATTDENGKTVRRPSMVDLSSIIEREARKNGIDPLIVELIIQQESGFDPYATSPSGAQGLMQLMPGTATMLGVTDPYDIEQNVAGGTAYFATQLRRFQDLGLALAAYNAGPGAVASCGGVPPYTETQNYVANICSRYSERRRSKTTGQGG
jgi:soluble lytic murein transglycosylase-like protein